MARRLLFFLFCFVISTSASDGRGVPKPGSGDQAFVYDEPGIFSQIERNQLITKLKNYHDSTSNEIAIVVESTLNGEDKFNRSLEIASEWGVGGESFDNGVLIYMAMQEREIFIQVGYGLEGVLPDSRTGRIIRNIMTPAFKEGRYYDGLNGAIDKMILYASGEYVNEGENKKLNPQLVVLVVIVIIVILLMLFGGGKNGRTYQNRRDSHWGPWWGAGGGFGGGGGGFGGGGGGFGGFGGGGFGGGGAGGSW